MNYLKDDIIKAPFKDISIFIKLALQVTDKNVLF